MQTHLVQSSYGIYVDSISIALHKHVWTYAAGKSDDYDWSGCSMDNEK